MAYRYYDENAMPDVNVLGAHWLEWVDEPSTGRFDACMRVGRRRSTGRLACSRCKSFLANTPRRDE